MGLRSLAGSLVTSTLAAVALFILLAPIALPVSVAFSEAPVISFPPQGFTLRWFRNILEFRSLVNGFVYSLEIALASSTIALGVALPATYALYRYAFRGKRAVESLFLLPITLPDIVISYMLLLYLVKAVGVSAFNALIAGHVLILLPYSMRYTYASLVNLSPEVEDAAVSLGASRARAFREVVLPNIRTGLVAAFVMSFITSFNAFSISLFLSYGNVMPLPIAMWNYLQVRYDPTIAALSFVLVLFTLGFVILVRRLIGVWGVWR